MKLIQFLNYHLLFLLLLGGYLLFSFTTYSDYGITFDEHGVYENGESLYNYLFNRTPTVELAFNDDSQHINRLQVYNHAYAAVLYAINPEQFFEIYHLLNMLLLAPLLVASYILFLSLFDGSRYAVIAPITLLLIPRFIGHGPSNPKDFPFAVFYMLSLIAIHLTKSSLLRCKIPLLGLLFGITHAQRVLGLGTYFFFVAHVLLTTPFSLRKLTKKLWILLPIGLIGIGIHLFSQPYLLTNTLIRFEEIMRLAQAYPWSGSILFMGAELPAGSLPWYYIPVWIAMTTPIGILVGCVLSLRYLTPNYPFAALLWIFIEFHFILLLISRPNIYDGLRHFLFILPAIGLLCSYSFIGYMRSIRHSLRLPMIVMALFYGFSIIWSMIRLHPYEYIYFNELAGGLVGAAGYMETDYWGSSYKSLANWLSSQQLLSTGEEVYVCHDSMQVGYYLEDGIGVSQNLDKAKYALCTTRNNMHRPLIDRGEVVFVEQRMGVPLSYVIRLHQ